MCQPCVPFSAWFSLTHYQERNGRFTKCLYLILCSLTQKYQLTIRDVSQPILVSRPKKNYSHSGDESLIYLVPELCRMTGRRGKMRTNSPSVQELVKYTHLVPSQRVERLQKFNSRRKTQSEVSLSNLIVPLSPAAVTEVLCYWKPASVRNFDFVFPLQFNLFYRRISKWWFPFS
jgi:hypothetical protein